MNHTSHFVVVAVVVVASAVGHEAVAAAVALVGDSFDLLVVVAVAAVDQESYLLPPGYHTRHVSHLQKERNCF